MGKCIDLTGMRFGHLLVLYRAPDKIRKDGRKQVMWHCLCDCGKECDVYGTSLRCGLTISCGCFHSKQLTQNNKDRQLYNTYDLSGEFGIGYTNNTNKDGENEFYFDLEDYDKIKDYTWYFHVSGYVVSQKNGERIKMHQLILNVDQNYVPDHINRKRNDNRKVNLRQSTNHENSMNASLAKNNTSGVTGVMWHSRDQIWEVCIGYNYKRIYIGRFDNFYDAVVARLKAEIKYFGEYAPQKHLFKEYGIEVDNEYK